MEIYKKIKILIIALVFAWVYVEPLKQGFDLDSSNVEQKLLV